MKPAKATVKNEQVSFALKEQETGVVLDGVIKRAKENVFAHIRQSTDIVLVTSNNRDGKTAFIAELSKEIDSEIRSLSLHSDDLLNASNKNEASNDVDFSLISAIIYESINLNEYLLISIDDADKLPIDNFNDLVTLALSTNSKKNNIIFLFAGGPDLLSQIEQISNIRRLSIAHCTLDELMFEDLVEFIDLRQNNLPDDQQYNFDEQALKTIVTHASGSLFKAAVLLEWCREYSNFNQNQEISAGTVSQLLSVLLNKSQVDGVNLFATYPTSDFDFSSSVGNIGNQPSAKKKSTEPKRAKTRRTNQKKSSQESQNIEIKIVSDKSSENKPNVYERIMADASEEELISESLASSESDEVETQFIEIPKEESTDDSSSPSDPVEIETKLEDLILEEQPLEKHEFNEEKITNITIEASNIDNLTSKEVDSAHEESKPLYIENTDLSLTRLVPKQGSKSGTLSSLQWTFIILIIGAILFYGGIMFIASNGNIENVSTTEAVISEPLTLESSSNINEGDGDSVNETLSTMPVPDEAPIDPIEKNISANTPSVSDRIKSFFASLASDNTEQQTSVVVNSSADFDVPSVAPSGGTIMGQKESTIQALLSLAKLQMESKKLTSPPSDNALDTYRMVLQLDPTNDAATSGVESIRVRYLIWAEQQAMAGNSGQAKFYLERAMEMSTDSQ